MNDAEMIRQIKNIINDNACVEKICNILNLKPKYDPFANDEDGDTTTADNAKIIAKVKAKLLKQLNQEFNASKKEMKYSVGLYEADGCYVEGECFSSKRERDSWISQNLETFDESEGAFVLSYVLDNDACGIYAGSLDDTNLLAIGMDY